MQIAELKVIVTGAGAGMGAHFARRLHESGAQVVAADIDAAALDGLPAGIFKVRLDVSDEDQCADAVRKAAGHMGGVNALINNAGILRDGLLVKRDRTTGAISKLSAANWHAVLAVNLTGATFMVRETVAHMAEAGLRPGVVVNLSSIARHGNRGQSNYVAAKAALAANTVTWSREFAPFGVRVCAVAPGVIDTPMTRGMNQAALERIVMGIPVGRIGQPEDIWQAVRFCLECEYFNGRTIDVDGGAAF